MPVIITKALHFRVRLWSAAVYWSTPSVGLK